MITGATNGIGKAYALELAKEGFNIILVARSLSRLDYVAQKIKKLANVEVRTVAYDYSKLDSEADVKNYTKLMEDATKDIDLSILINNVGFGFTEEFATDSVESAIEFVNVNVKSYVHTTKIFLPRLLARKPKAAIINVGSNPQNSPIGLITMYASTKTFTYTFSRSLQ